MTEKKKETAVAILANNNIIQNSVLSITLSRTPQRIIKDNASGFLVEGTFFSLPQITID